MVRLSGGGRPVVGSTSRAIWGAVFSVALVAGTIHGSAALPAWASDDNPSWADVEAARDNAAATAHQLELIDSALTNLESRSAALGDAAVEASALAESTKRDLDDAVTRAAAIVEQRDAAEAEVESTSAQLGRITAATYRSGTGGLVVRILLDNDSDDDLLYQLTVSAQLGSAAHDLRERATTQSNLMQSLDEQAAEVARERDRLATLAEQEADAAASAQRAADEQLAAQQRRSDDLFAQLAVLKNSSADLERGYRDRIAAEAAYKEQQEQAAADAQKQTPGSGDNVAGTDPGQAPSKPKPTKSPKPTQKPTPPPPPVSVIVDPAAAKAYAASAVSSRGWNGSEYNCLLWLWNRESGWRADAHNPYSGAYGIPQSLPGHKMASAGGDWRTNAATQINWGLGYIANSYGAPCGAWAHSEAYNWY